MWYIRQHCFGYQQTHFQRISCYQIRYCSEQCWLIDVANFAIKIKFFISVIHFPIFLHGFFTVFCLALRFVYAISKLVFWCHRTSNLGSVEITVFNLVAFLTKYFRLTGAGPPYRFCFLACKFLLEDAQANVEYLVVLDWIPFVIIFVIWRNWCSIKAQKKLFTL